LARKCFPCFAGALVESASLADPALVEIDMLAIQKVKDAAARKMVGRAKNAKIAKESHAQVSTSDFEFPLRPSRQAAVVLARQEVGGREAMGKRW
jgi:hypothetical protein